MSADTSLERSLMRKYDIRLARRALSAIINIISTSNGTRAASIGVVVADLLSVLSIKL